LYINKAPQRQQKIGGHFRNPSSRFHAPLCAAATGFSETKEGSSDGAFFLWGLIPAKVRL
jgi:hypothetical protein